MQFSCESCKTQLQIADEKVKGKRLIVRCRRCGAKIAIADPALSKAPPRVVQAPASASQPSPMRVSPLPQAAATPQRPATDVEDTQSMDSQVLEKAIEASKAEDAATVSRPPPAPVSTPTDAPTWFAMLQGKQTGPLTRKEVEAKTNEAEIGPRTYLWRDGMSAWQRAKDVPELAALFPKGPPPLPTRSPPEPRKAPAIYDSQPHVPAGLAPEPRRPKADGGATEPFSLLDPPLPGPDEAALLAGSEEKAADLARWASEELAKKPAASAEPAAAAAPRTAMFESAAPERRSPALLIFAVLAVLAAAAAVLWIALSDRDRNEPRHGKSQALPGAAQVRMASLQTRALSAKQVRDLAVIVTVAA